jgi:hypothetical protein
MACEHVSVHNWISRLNYSVNLASNLLLNISLRLLLTSHHVEEVRSLYSSNHHLPGLRHAVGPVLTKLAVPKVALIQLSSSLLITHIRFINRIMRHSGSMWSRRSTHNTVFIVGVLAGWETGSALSTKGWFIVLLVALSRCRSHLRNSLIHLWERHSR